MKSSHHKRIIFIIVGILILATGFSAGFLFGKSKNIAQGNTSVNSFEQVVGLGQFWSVWNLLNEKYPFKEKIPTDTDRIYGAIAGMVSSIGDPYTVFFSPKEAKTFAEDVKGEFGGIGIEVANRDGLLTVVSPLKDTPAEKSGILAGDVIVKINGNTTEGMTTDHVVNIIRGKIGTTVNLDIYRKGEIDFKTFTITRENIVAPVIDTKIEGDVFVISLHSFSESSTRLFKESFQEFKSSGLKKMIIDVRNNPGGYLDSAVDIGSYFVPQGKILVRENNGDIIPEKLIRSHGSDTVLPNGFKMVILTNNGSASASEILAGALSEHGIADIVGTKTFGKGSIQELVSLPDGSSLKVTVAKWFTPNGVSISEKGITPKFIVEEKATEENKDPIFNKAFELLKGQR